MTNYLVEGLSGTGKTTVGEELQRRGYRVVDADKVFGFYGDPETELPTENKSQLTWLWKKDKVEEELSKAGETTFVTGGAMNMDKFKHHFGKIFVLFVDDETLKSRLLSRTNNDFGKKPEDLARQLEWNQGTDVYAKEKGYILIDATKPLGEVVGEILRYIS